MIYRIVIVLFMLLYFIYMTTVIAHCLNICKITYQDIKIGKALIPLYYWFKRENNERSNNCKQG